MCRPLNYFTPHLSTLLNAHSQEHIDILTPDFCSVPLTLQQTASMVSPPTTNFYSFPYVVTDTFLSCISCILSCILSPPVPTCHYALLTLVLFSTLSSVLYCCVVFKWLMMILSLHSVFYLGTSHSCTTIVFAEAYLLFFSLHVKPCILIFLHHLSALSTDHNVTSEVFFQSIPLNFKKSIESWTNEN